MKIEKFIKTADLRVLEKQVSLGEISYSRMIEILNEKSDEYAMQEAIGFAEWIEKQGWKRVYVDNTNIEAWVNVIEHDIFLIHGSKYQSENLVKKYGKSTQELYNIFDK